MRRSNTTTEMMKEYIADSLLILMDKKSYSEISIGEITKRAGVNRSTYYRNFMSKEQIVKFYFNKIISEYLDTINDGDTFFEYLNKMFSCFYNYKTELMLIYKNNISYLILDALNESFVAHRKTSFFEEKFRLYYHTGGIYNNFLLWFSEDMKQTPKQMSEMTIKIVPEWVSPALLQ